MDTINDVHTQEPDQIIPDIESRWASQVTSNVENLVEASKQKGSDESVSL